MKRYQQCVEGGLISPTNCPYMSDWLHVRGGHGGSEEHSRRGSLDLADGLNMSGQKRRASESLAW
jgi:hypothetical protein